MGQYDVKEAELLKVNVLMEIGNLASIGTLTIKTNLCSEGYPTTMTLDAGSQGKFEVVGMLDIYDNEDGYMHPVVDAIIKMRELTKQLFK